MSSTSLLLKRGLSYPGSFNPGFDPSHILATGGNVRFSGISSNGGNFTNLLNGVSAIRNGPSVTTLHGICGPTMNNVASGNNFCKFTGSPTNADSVMTLATIFVHNGTSQDILINSTSSITAGYGLFANPTLAIINANGSLGGSSGVSLTVGTPYFVIMSAISASKVNYLIMNLTNGSIKTAAVGSGLVSSTASDGNIIIGGNGAGNASNCQIATAAWSAVYLSIPQMLLAAADPWSFWYPNQKISSNFLFGNQTQAAPFDGHYNSQIYKLQRSFY